MNVHINREQWIPACGGTETWTSHRDGKEYLYVWWRNAPEGTPGSCRHAWLDRNDILHWTQPGNDYAMPSVMGELSDIVNHKNDYHMENS